MKRFWMVRLLTLFASTAVFSGAVADTVTEEGYSSSDYSAYSTAVDPDFPNADPNQADYNQVGKPVQDGPDSLTFSNQDFGMQGPVKVTGTYSSAFGYELEAAYTRLLNSMNAISLLSSYSDKENRIDLTWAHAWDAKQRTKISVERLAQKLDFDYDSGSVSEWVPQYTVGAGYQYLFDQGWLNAMEFSGYYAQADSKDLDTVRYTADDDNLYDNYRHIAGATSKGVELSADLLPWNSSMFTVGLNYDAVNYDTKYEDTDAEDSNGLGFTVGLQQVLSKHSKFEVDASQRETYDTYSAKVSVLTPNDMELGFTTETTVGNDNTNENRYSLDLAYYIDDHNRYKTGYSMGAAASGSSLASWAAESLAYMNLVLAAADQKTVRVVNTSEDTNSNSLQSSESTINLVTGSINTVSIASSIDNADLTAAQLAKGPKIFGGPNNVTFAYNAKTESLTTEQAVPEDDAGQVSKPIVVVFPTDEQELKGLTPAERTKRKLKNSLKFKAVVASSVNPYNNPGFETDYTVITNEPLNLPVFYLENPQSPAVSPQGPNTLFINPSDDSEYLYLDAFHGGNEAQITDQYGCYKSDYSYYKDSDFKDQKLEFSLKNGPSVNCPDAATFTVKACNSFGCSTQVMNIAASVLAIPAVNGDVGIAYAQTNTAYSNQFSATQVSAGKDSNDNFATFNEEETTLTVMDGDSCTDVTDTSGLSLQFNNNSGSDPSVQPTVTLTSSGSLIPESFSHNPMDQLKVYLHVVNNESDPQEADNGSADEVAACTGTPFFLPVAAPPTLGNPEGTAIDLGTEAAGTSAVVDEAYSYSFADHNVMTTGSSNLDSVASVSTLTVLDSSNNVVATDPNDLGLALTINGTDITLAGTLAAKYAGDKLQVILNPLYNTGNSTIQPTPVPALSTNNSAEPAVLELSANPAQAPKVTGGSEVNPAQTSNLYQAYNFGTDVSAGTGRSYDNLNTGASDSDTYVKVVTADTSATDVTNKVHVQLSDNGDGTLSLINTGTVADSSLASGDYNVFVHVYNDAKVTASNCDPEDCSNLSSSNANNTPFIMEVTNTTPNVTGGSALTNGTVTTGAAYSNTFTLEQVSAGGNQNFANLNTESTTGTFAKITRDNGDGTETDVPLTDFGFSLAQVNSNGPFQLQLASGGVPDSIQSGDYNMYIYITNDTDAPQSASNCDDNTCTSDPLSGTPFTFTVTNPTENPAVPGGSPVNAAETDVAYADFTFPSTLTAGMFHEFQGLNTVSETGTYVKVTNPDGSDATTALNVALATSGSGDDQQLVLIDKASGKVATSLLSSTDENPYQVFIHTYNGEQQASNCSDAACSSGYGYDSGTPYTMKVTNITPSVFPANSTNPFTTAAAGSAFPTYTFAAGSTAASTGEVNSGDGETFTGLNSTSLVTVTDSDGNDVTTDMNVQLAQTTASNVTQLQLVSSGPVVSSSLHSGSYNVCVAVTNTANQSATNCDSGDAAFVLNLTNTLENPSVPGGQDLLGTETNIVYSTTPQTLTGVTAGQSNTYSNLNPGMANKTTDSTYVKVLDSNGDDVTDQLGVQLAVSGDNLQLVGDGATKVSTALDGEYSVFVHVYNDPDHAQASNCGDPECSAPAYGSADADTIMVTNTAPIVGGGAIQAATTNVAYAGQTFSTTASPKISSGDGNPGYQSYELKITDGAFSGTDVSGDLHVVLNDVGNGQLALQTDGTPVDQSLDASSYNVYVKVTNNNGEVACNYIDAASGCNGSSDTPFTMAFTNTMPSVNGSALPDPGTTGTSYTETLPDVSPGAAGLNGTPTTYANVVTTPPSTGSGAASSDTQTYIKISDSAGNDVTAAFSMALEDPGAGSTLTMHSAGIATNLDSGDYNVYVHIYNSAGEESSNCASSSCNAGGDDPYILTLNKGTEQVYLTCPSGSESSIYSGESTPIPTSEITAVSNGANVANQNFSAVSPNLVVSTKVLHVAKLVPSGNGYVLQCQYNPVGVNVSGSNFYQAQMNGSTSEILPADAHGVTGSDGKNYWSGTECNLDNASVFGDDNSCRIQYTKTLQ